MGEIVNLDGVLLRPEEARIPVHDHGFLYGDSIYETLRTWGGQPFLVDRHLRRLRGSAERIFLRLPWEPDRFREEILRAIAAAGNAESALRVVVSRGTGPIGLDPAACRTPTVVIFAFPAPDWPARYYEEGCDLVIAHVRRNAPDALDPQIKSGNLLNNILGLMEARRAGAFECLFLGAHGYLTEASSSNVFVVSGGKLRTPREGSGLLSGITRGLVLELAAEVGIPAGEAEIPPGDLFTAEEAFLTSTTKGIMPVARVDGRPIGPGRPGPVTTRLREAYFRFVERETGRRG